MGSKKKVSKKFDKKKKPKPDSALMSEVEKSNPSFVAWLRNKKTNKE
jgi:hypothetical protein